MAGYELCDKLNLQGKEPLPPLENDSKFQIRKGLETRKHHDEERPLQSC